MKQRKLNVTYRDLERKDYPYIEKIIRDTWNYDSICDRPSTAKQMAKVYLRGCLAQKTYARVAVCRDRVVGIIVGQYGKDRKMKETGQKQGTGKRQIDGKKRQGRKKQGFGKR